MRIMKLHGVLLTLVLIFGVPPATQAGAMQPGASATTTAWLNLRAGPSLDDAVLQVIPSSADVSINSGPYHTVWYHVTYRGTLGYVHGAYLTPTTGPARSPAELARQVVGAPYLFGGKGYDLWDLAFIEPEQVRTGYYYYNSALDQARFARGLDCSGLVLWSYSKAFGATRYLQGPVRYDGADSQYRYDFTQDVAEAEVQPGDMLFFDWEPQDGYIDHVAMYVGNDEVVEARNPHSGIRLIRMGKLTRHPGFLGFRRLSDP